MIQLSTGYKYLFRASGKQQVHLPPVWSCIEKSCVTSLLHDAHDGTRRVTGTQHHLRGPFCHRPDARNELGFYTRYFHVTRGIMATGRKWAPQLKPYRSISIRIDTTGFHTRLREGPYVDRPSQLGSQSRGEGAVPLRDAAPALPAARADASVRGARRAPPPRAPAISESGTAPVRARTPRQVVALAPRALWVPSAGCWCVPTPEDYDSHHATRSRRRAHGRGAPARRPIQLCALHAGYRCSPRGFASQRPAEGCGARPREPPRPRVASRSFSV